MKKIVIRTICFLISVLMSSSAVFGKELELGYTEEQFETICRRYNCSEELFRELTDQNTSGLTLEEWYRNQEDTIARHYDLLNNMFTFSNDESAAYGTVLTSAEEVSERTFNDLIFSWESGYDEGSGAYGRIFVTRNGETSLLADKTGLNATVLTNGEYVYYSEFIYEDKAVVYRKKVGDQEEEAVFSTDADIYFQLAGYYDSKIYYIKELDPGMFFEYSTGTREHKLLAENVTFATQNHQYFLLEPYYGDVGREGSLRICNGADQSVTDISDRICLYGEHAKIAGDSVYYVEYTDLKDYYIPPAAVTVKRLALDGNQSETLISGLEMNSVLSLTDEKMIYTGADQEEHEILWEENSADGNAAEATDNGNSLKGYPEYEEIVRKYYQGVSAGWNLQEFNENGLCYLAAYDSDLDSIGYCLIDIDNNNICELLIGYIDRNDCPGMFYELYTSVNGEAVPVAMSWERNRYYLCEDDTIANEGSGSAWTSSWSYYDLNAGQLLFRESVFADGYYDEKSPWFYTDTAPYEDYSSPISEEMADEIRNGYVYRSIPFIPLSEMD